MKAYSKMACKPAVTVLFVILSILMLTKADELDKTSSISSRFEKLEQRINDQDSVIDGLRRTVEAQEGIIQKQNHRIEQIEQSLQTEQSIRKKHSLLLQVIQKAIGHGIQLDPLQTLADDGTKGDTERTGGRIRQSDPGVKMFARRQEGTGVSFSAYLDHNIDTSSHQTVKFNKIITNEGSGYNLHTGVFTCPEPGMYLFIFNIGERGINGPNGVGTRLIVNSANIVDSVVDSFHTTQDLQGGNAAVVRLTVGDSVWVETTGGHVQGSDTYRFTTFLGAYLYP